MHVAPILDIHSFLFVDWGLMNPSLSNKVVCMIVWRNVDK